MTLDSERMLRSAQRTMLRRILGSPRHVGTATATDSEDSEETDDAEAGDECEDYIDQGESWIEWIQRTTWMAEGQLSKTGIDDWVVGQRKRQWRFAGHTARLWMVGGRMQF